MHNYFKRYYNVKRGVCKESILQWVEVALLYFYLIYCIFFYKKKRILQLLISVFFPLFFFILYFRYCNILCIILVLSSLSCIFCIFFNVFLLNRPSGLIQSLSRDVRLSCVVVCGCCNRVFYILGNPYIYWGVSDHPKVSPEPFSVT